ncbi:MAG: hypothetical protein ACT4OM_07455 [Actinomycetota bacterium]
MIRDSGWLSDKWEAMRILLAYRRVPPFIKFGGIVAAGILPFAAFVMLQPDSGRSQGTNVAAQVQLPVNQSVPLAFPFGTPQPSLEPTTTTIAGSTTTSLRVTTSAPPRQCNNGLDDDRDGRIDMADPGCSSRNDNSEFQAAATAPPATAPPATQPPATTLPTTTTTVTLPPAAPPTTAAPSEPPVTRTIRQVLGECSDGIDNDGDGKTDLEDRASCHGDPTSDE